MLGLIKFNSYFRKDQLQKNLEQLQQRTLLGIRVLCIDFISLVREISINTGELFAPAGNAQIREDRKSENIANEGNDLRESFLMNMKKMIRNFGEEREMFITT